MISLQLLYPTYRAIEKDQHCFEIYIQRYLTLIIFNVPYNYITLKDPQQQETISLRYTYLLPCRYFYFTANDSSNVTDEGKH